MSVAVRSFAKINIGLSIGRRHPDGFHELRTVYQTLALYDTVRVDVRTGTGVEIRCKDPRVPQDESNTCWRVAERVMRAVRTRGRVIITIEKQLPVQGGVGAASSNAVATLLGLERLLRAPIDADHRLDITTAVGSDLPLFLVGGTVLGCGHGEEVYPLADLPAMPCVLAISPAGVSTPQAFADWDKLVDGDNQERAAAAGRWRNPETQGGGSRAGLTPDHPSSKINMFSRSIFGWLTGSYTGVPAGRSKSAVKSGNRAERNSETPLLDLVRAGIENDFERVVFPQHPELREVKRLLQRQGARYASLSGSGSTVFGLFDTAAEARQTALRLTEDGIPSLATRTLPRREYWTQVFV